MLIVKNTGISYETAGTLFQDMMANVPPELQLEVKLSFDIADRICQLMEERGLSKKQFAEAFGRRPSEITKWLSGQHNFTLRTIAKLSTFFGKPIVTV